MSLWSVYILLNVQLFARMRYTYRSTLYGIEGCEAEIDELDISIREYQEQKDNAERNGDNCRWLSRRIEYCKEKRDHLRGLFKVYPALRKDYEVPRPS